MLCIVPLSPAQAVASNANRIFFVLFWKLNSGDARSICLKAQTSVEKKSSFKVFFIPQISYTPGVSNSNCSEGETRTKKKQGSIMTTLGPRYVADATKEVPEPY